MSVRGKNRSFDILYIGKMSSSFQKGDYEILNNRFATELVHKPKNRTDFFNYILKLVRKMPNCKVVYVWFASWVSLFAVVLSKIFGKKTIIITGGYDCVYLPEIGYGARTNLVQYLPARFVYNHADFVIPFSRDGKKNIMEMSHPKNLETIYLGIDIGKLSPRSQKENVAITVARISWKNVYRKGVETFIRAAEHIPEIPCIVIGRFTDDSITYLKSIAPSNVKFTGYVTDEKLVQWYQMAKVYVQISAHEGFGMAMAEAMACSAIPVVTRRGAIPEVVGDTGFYVPYSDAKATAEAIKKALNAPEELGKKARERIKNNFPVRDRECRLIEIINNNIGEG